MTDLYGEKYLRKQRDRLRRTTGGRNPFEEVIIESVQQTEQLVAVTKVQITAREDATKLLAEFVDAVPAAEQPATLQSFLLGGTSGSSR